ncbi:MAG: acetyltransferase [Pantoea eucrina]|jgi:surface polysaccharide O-acyltransferase-like enzyme|uniref:acyltransferase n=1 Tax=unclassified Pantoea TaxID=2630326 RepID=UPI0025F4ECD7|nr:acyltransferase [Pantoea sp. UBA4549]MDF2785745.1 acetyltransferase [Pantoea eucrina]
MPQKISWIDNLRAVACLMVIVIHTTTWYITGPMAVTGITWDVTNLMNAASRVCVPLFFMISGYLFFGERSAQARHLIRIVLCLLFYSAVALAYITWLTPISEGRSIMKLLQKPVFYHLWFFFAIIGIYLLSPLIQVKTVQKRYVALLVVVLAVVANPNTVSQSVGSFRWLPVNLYVSGDSFYYLLYALLGRAIGCMETGGRRISWLAGSVFIACVLGIALGTKQLLKINGAFNDTWYLYCGPLVFIAAISLLVLFKNSLNQRPLPLLATISRYSLPVYGFHALFIHYLRTHHYDDMSRPWLDLPWVFGVTLLGSLLLAMLLKRIDTRQLVS